MDQGVRCHCRRREKRRTGKPDLPTTSLRCYRSYWSYLEGTYERPSHTCRRHRGCTALRNRQRRYQRILVSKLENAPVEDYEAYRVVLRCRNSPRDCRSGSSSGDRQPPVRYRPGPAIWLTGQDEAGSRIVHERSTGCQGRDAGRVERWTGPSAGRCSFGNGSVDSTT
jgi:hypothetical protein